MLYLGALCSGIMEALADAERTALEAIETPHHEHRFLHSLLGRFKLGRRLEEEDDEDDRDLKAAARHRQQFEASLRHILDSVAVEATARELPAPRPDQAPRAAAQPSVPAPGPQPGSPGRQDPAASPRPQQDGLNPQQAAPRTDAHQHREEEETGISGRPPVAPSGHACLMREKSSSVGGYLNTLSYRSQAYPDQLQLRQESPFSESDSRPAEAEEEPGPRGASAAPDLWSSDGSEASAQWEDDGSEWDPQHSCRSLMDSGTNRQVLVPSEAFMRNWNQHTSFHRRRSVGSPAVSRRERRTSAEHAANGAAQPFEIKVESADDRHSMDAGKDGTEKGDPQPSKAKAASAGAFLC